MALKMLVCFFAYIWQVSSIYHLSIYPPHHLGHTWFAGMGCKRSSSALWGRSNVGSTMKQLLDPFGDTISWHNRLPGTLAVSEKKGGYV